MSHLFVGSCRRSLNAIIISYLCVLLLSSSYINIGYRSSDIFGISCEVFMKASTTSTGMFITISLIHIHISGQLYLYQHITIAFNFALYCIFEIIITIESHTIQTKKVINGNVNILQFYLANYLQSTSFLLLIFDVNVMCK